MPRLGFILAALLLSLQLSADTVFKCVDESGHTVFSDKKCSGSAEKLDFKHPETWQERLAREKSERDAALSAQQSEYQEKRRETDIALERMKRQHEQLCSARAQQQGLVIGMTKDQLYKSDVWGYPDSTSTTTTANVVKDYLVYKCQGFKDVRLFVTNGLLTSIHN